jgi:hypothetical protein
LHDSKLETFLQEDQGVAVAEDGNPTSSVPPEKAVEEVGLPPLPEPVPGAAPVPTAALPASPLPSALPQQPVAGVGERLEALRQQVLALGVGEEISADAQADEASDSPLPSNASAGAPLAGALPFDIEAARRGLDAFFEHLGGIVRSWPGAQTFLRISPWLAAATALAVEAIRQQRKKSAALGPEHDGGPTAASMTPGGAQ